MGQQSPGGQSRMRSVPCADSLPPFCSQGSRETLVMLVPAETPDSLALLGYAPSPPSRMGREPDQVFQESTWKTGVGGHQGPSSNPPPRHLPHFLTLGGSTSSQSRPCP